MRTPVKAIRAKCLDCSGNILVEVRECPVDACPLYPYRFGKRPAATDRTSGQGGKRRLAVASGESKESDGSSDVSANNSSKNVS